MRSTFKAALLSATVMAATTASHAAPVTSSVSGTTVKIGTINLAAIASGQSGGTLPPAASPARGLPEYRMLPRPGRPAISATSDLLAAGGFLPTVRPSEITAASLSGFVGLTHYDQRNADGGNQFSLEPPDQALAVGNGFVLEAVNDVLQVYDTAGNPKLAAPVSTNRFFNQVSQINRTTGQEGPFLSDPRAYYDAATQRFIVVEWATLNYANGAPLGISVQFIAVSQTSDPTQNWYIYNYETTNSDQAGCPCFGDYQQLGVDANGIYIAANLFPIFGGNYVGQKTYALSKAGLEAGTGSPVLSFPVRPNDFTIHPTVIPAGGSFASEDNGTEYAVEARADLTNNSRAKVVNIYAISNTNSLNTSTPVLRLRGVGVKTETYGNALNSGLPPAIQPDGPRPLGNSLGDPVPLLDADTSEVGSTPVYVNGQIWAAIPTAINAALSTAYDGVYWLDVAASGGVKSLSAKLTAQGFVAAPKGTSLLYPAIAMPTTGQGEIGVTLTGPYNYPSTAVISLSASGTGPIQISGVGALPDDGFTAYPQYGGGGVGRWGDYGAAAVDESGNLWLANEFIPNTAQYPRTSLANWGTYITQITP